MRITVWNINGLRTVKGYQPWYKLEDWQACIDHLGADIACFQETKMTRKQLQESMCIMPKYHSFFNFHPTKGYSGTVTYVKKEMCIPLKAEQGITGRFVPDPFNNQEAIGGYPREVQDQFDPQLYYDLDDEGRAVVLDCGLFVLFNVYAPNETGPERLEYKMSYYHCLAERAHRLIKAGRQVMIVGDMNIVRDAIDHCDPERAMKETDLTDFKLHPARVWFNEFLAPKGQFHDVARLYHPERKSMFTCWNTLIDARPANYGVRLDYTLVTEGLLPWIKDADIQPNIYGSDHCPIYIDLYDERQIQGKVVLLKSLLHGGQDRPAPSLAACHYSEFSSKQRKLASFFTAKREPIADSKQSKETLLKQESFQPCLADDLFALDETSENGSKSQPDQLSDIPLPSCSSSSLSSYSTSQQNVTTSNPIYPLTGSTFKRQASSTSKSLPTKKQVKPSKGQMKLQTFFSKPLSDKSVSSTATEATPITLSNESMQESQASLPSELVLDEIESTSSLELSSSPFEQERSAVDRVDASLAWGSIFTATSPPNCRSHNEPTKAWTVNKPGANHGRKFWLCSRPVGPGYEKSGRAKEDVNPLFRCNFFMWDSERRSQVSKERKRTATTTTDSNKAFAEIEREKKKVSEITTTTAPHKRVKYPT